jgi:hypothetical protein
VYLKCAPRSSRLTSFTPSQYLLGSIDRAELALRSKRNAVGGVGSWGFGLAGATVGGPVGGFVGGFLGSLLAAELVPDAPKKKKKNKNKKDSEEE